MLLIDLIAMNKYSCMSESKQFVCIVDIRTNILPGGETQLMPAINERA